MAWIAHGGRSGRAILENRRGRYDIDSECEDDALGGNQPRFKGVPLCGAAVCSGPGLPPKRLPKPGIDCINGDQPCLPCDIVNVRLRVAVTGSKVKRAIAECQKRYFCRVWNLLFAYLFPNEHREGPCPHLKPNDPMPICGGHALQSLWRQRGQRKQQQQQQQQLPFGANPYDAVGPVGGMQMTDHRVRRGMPPTRQAQSPSQTQQQGPRQLTPRAPSKPRGGNLRYNLVDRPYLAKDSLKSHKIRGATPKKNRGLRGNYYDLPTLDSQKRA